VCLNEKEVSHIPVRFFYFPREIRLHPITR
jgi:hypothetical protein